MRYIRPSRLFLLVLPIILCLVPTALAAAGTYVLPDDLCVIEAEAFHGDTSLDTVVLHEGVTDIGSKAFANSSLKKIYLPDSLTSIAPDAFRGCSSNLLAVVCDGSYAMDFCSMYGIRYETSVIVEHPVSVTVDCGRPAAFSVGITDPGTAFQWQYMLRGSSEWVDFAGETSADLTFTSNKQFHQARFRCIVTDMNGYQFFSDPATLTVVRHIAVLVGNGDYVGDENDLDGPPCDIVAFSGALRTLDQGWEVYTYPNQSVNGIRSAISSRFAGADRDDICLFFYSGHGTSDGELCGVDMTYLESSQLETALSGATPGKVIVIVDACFSGKVIGVERSRSAMDFNDAFISAFSGITIPAEIPEKSGELARPGKYYVITACTGSQTSFDWEDDYGNNGGMMTLGLVTEGMGCLYPDGAYSGSMPGDTDGDSLLTLGELVGAIRSYVRNELALWTEYTEEDHNKTSSYGSTDFVFFHRY